MNSTNIPMIHCQKAREYLCGVYLDWKNNYTSIETFSEHHGLYVDEAIEFIGLCRKVFKQKAPEE